MLTAPIPNVMVVENGDAILTCSPSISTVHLMWIAEIPITQILFNTTRYHFPDSACTDEYCHSINVPNVTQNYEGRYFCYVRGDRVSIFESIDNPLVEPAFVILTLDIGQLLIL